MNENLPFELKNIPETNIMRFVFNAPVKNSVWKKVTAVRLADGSFQIEKLTEKQAFHEKISADEKLFEHNICLLPR